jgi:hypothetical protein
MENVMSRTDSAATAQNDWLDAFEGQVTDELYARATRYATRLAAGVAQVDRHADQQYVHDIVQAAIVDTLIGVVVWDPASYSLEAHILNTIKSRCHHDRDRAIGAPHLPFDPNDSAESLRVAEVLRDGVEETGDPAEHAERCLDMLREIAVRRKDGEVLAMLDCFGRGELKLGDVASKGWRANRWRNAKRRLERYAGLLPMHGIAK